MNLKDLILLLLSETPATGYQLQKAIKMVPRLWDASHQQVYKLCKGMRKEGLVNYEPITQVDRPDCKMYRLTNAGMAAVEALQCGDHLTAGENKYHGADTVMLFAGNKAYFISAIDKVERQLAEEREEERRVVCELERMLIHRTMLLNESRLEWYKMAIDMIESDKRPTMMDKLEL